MFAENLKTLRKSKGLSQEELAIRLNVVRQTISKWEKGLSVPDADLLIQISEVLEVSVTELLGAKIENEREIGAVAEQLSRINEQLAIRNRRARRIWRTAGIALATFLFVGVLLVVIGIVSFMAFRGGDEITGTTVHSIDAVYSDTVLAEAIDGGLRIGRYDSEDGMSWVQLVDANFFAFNRHSAMSYMPTGAFSVSDEKLTLKAGEDEEYVFIIKSDGLVLELESTYIEGLLEQGMQFVFSGLHSQ